MKFISSMYMSRHNFWCMTRGDSSHVNFQLQKVDWGPSGRQNWRKTMEFLKILYIHFIRDPKGITYVGFFLQIKSQAKMRWSLDTANTINNMMKYTTPDNSKCSKPFFHIWFNHYLLSVIQYATHLIFYLIITKMNNKKASRSYNHEECMVYQLLYEAVALKIKWHRNSVNADSFSDMCGMHDHKIYLLYWIYFTIINRPI